MYESSLKGEGLRIGVVVARFNQPITEKLLEGAVGCLMAQGVAEKDLQIAWVPGAFELPIVAQTMIDSGKVDAVVALGCVIRGETTHYDYVCNEAARGIAKVGLETGVPVIFGVITTENVPQAYDRVGGRHGHKGVDAAEAALEMVNLLKQLRPTAVTV